MGEYDRPKSDPAAIELRKQVNMSVERRRSLVADAELTAAFLSGNQWVNSSRSQGLVLTEAEADEIRVTDNKMLPA